MADCLKNVPARDDILVAFVTGIVLFLQIVNFSFMGETGKVGTLFFVAFATLALMLVFLIHARHLVYTSAHVWGLMAWLLIVAGSWQAFNSDWACLMAGVSGVYLVCFLLFSNLYWSSRQFAEKLIDAFLLLGLVAALLGVYEYVYFHTCGPSHSALIPYVLPPDINPRVGGPFGQSNLFALFLTLAQIAYFYRYLHGSSIGRRSLASFLRFLPVLTVATAFFLTYSRGGLVSWTLVFSALVWLVVTRRYLNGQREARKEFYLLLICLAVALLLSQVDPAGSSGSGTGAARLISEETGANNNTSGRFVFWMSAILIFLEYPWLGVGLDNYRFLMNSYGPASHATLGFVEFEAMMSTFWVHNEYLQLLCEGGIFLFAIVLFAVAVFFAKIWRHFIRSTFSGNPFFLYSHLFLLPFLIQSLFEWPLRHPALLLLFVAFAGILVAQYKLRSVSLPGVARLVAVVCVLLSLTATTVMFSHELKIMGFKRAWGAQSLNETIDDFSVLVSNPYSSYRILHNAMPGYTLAALRHERDDLAKALIPHSERLVRLEGAAGQWYDLARLYLRVDRLEDARIAIQKAFELKPTDTVIFSFLHHLNVIKASRATGRPIEFFYPPGLTPVDINFQELKHD